MKSMVFLLAILCLLDFSSSTLIRRQYAAAFSLGELLLAVNINYSSFTHGKLLLPYKSEKTRRSWRGLPQNRKRKKIMKTLKIPHSTHLSKLTSEHGLASRRRLQSSNRAVVYAAFLIFFRHLLFHVQGVWRTALGTSESRLLFLQSRTEPRTTLVVAAVGWIASLDDKGLAGHDGGLMHGY